MKSDYDEVVILKNMNEIEETVLDPIPGYGELYSFNKETNQV